MANCLLCSCHYINNPVNYKNIIMANREKFLHNFKKAKRQRKHQEFVLNNIFKGYSKGLIEIIKNNESK